MSNTSSQLLDLFVPVEMLGLEKPLNRTAHPVYGRAAADVSIEGCISSQKLCSTK